VCELLRVMQGGQAGLCCGRRGIARMYIANMTADSCVTTVKGLPGKQASNSSGLVL
jgi:hypothetical protein